MDVSLFDFELPEELIAQTPLLERTDSRLLILNKVTGAVEHQKFTQLLDHLHAGDTLVLNNTRVLPARLLGVKADTGARIELLLLSQAGPRWKVLAKPAKKVPVGTVVVFGDDVTKPKLVARVVSSGEMGEREVEFQYEGIFQEVLDQLGEMPLPPYIKHRLDNPDRYQTVYAKEHGSAAAPTAGLHFTTELLHEIEARGVELAYVTLHVGLGTFRPMSSETVEEHTMHAEYYELSAETAATLNATRARGGRIIAVGTTSARTLETVASEQHTRGIQTIQAASGWTSIFIYPGYTYKLVDALITNFHLPKSTLVMLVSALAGRKHVLNAYQQAIAERYRFFSFGDAMLVE